MSVETQEAFGAKPARLLARGPWERWPLWRRLALVLGIVALLAAAGYAGMLYYPDVSPPRGNEAEEAIAAVFGVPKGADGIVIGDLLVERFYAIDGESGERYVADFLKGRVQGVQESVNEHGIVSYALLLDLNNLQRDRALLAAYVEAVAPPEGGLAGYVGLRVAGGLRDAFPLNYDGMLPRERLKFRTATGEDVYEFLLDQRFAEVSQGARLVGMEGYNYLLSNTQLFPGFTSLFRINRAVFLSELILVDLTSREQAATYFRLFDRYPRSSAPR